MIFTNTDRKNAGANAGLKRENDYRARMKETWRWMSLRVFIIGRERGRMKIGSGSAA
ncbi:hypothetical protein [Paenibacillus sp. sgz302251]|uniref:hypothetical protein n=1 Tax=Paenibacillus sp. sgz302251 TaxID=3414493 RepID=UPI003C79F26A